MLKYLNTCQKSFRWDIWICLLPALQKRLSNVPDQVLKTAERFLKLNQVKEFAVEPKTAF